MDKREPERQQEFVSLLNEHEVEKRETVEQGNRFLVLIIYAITLPLVLLFTYFGKLDLGLNVGMCLGVNILAVAICWDLRRRMWFWCLDILVLALHVPLLLAIKWPQRGFRKIELLPIALADLVVTVGVVRLAEKLIMKVAPSEEKEQA